MQRTIITHKAEEQRRTVLLDDPRLVTYLLMTMRIGVRKPCLRTLLLDMHPAYLAGGTLVGNYPVVP